MQYVIKTADGGLPVSVEPGEEAGTYSVQLGDAPPELIAAHFLPDGTLSLQRAGRHHHVRLAPAAADVGSARIEGLVYDLRRWALLSAQTEQERADGPSTVVAPMAGRVARLLVTDGDEVAAGDSLIVVEAMKMENELRAARAGRVVNLALAPGAQVELNQELCRIE